jgi:hypothetical protein
LDAIAETGVILDSAAIEYGEAWKYLDGVSLIDAAKFYARHHGRDIKHILEFSDTFSFRTSKHVCMAIA